jgi:hypothetical protein
MLCPEVSDQNASPDFTSGMFAAWPMRSFELGFSLIEATKKWDQPVYIYIFITECGETK